MEIKALICITRCQPASPLFMANSLLIALQEFRARGRETHRVNKIDLTIVEQEIHLRGRVQLADSRVTSRGLDSIALWLFRRGYKKGDAERKKKEVTAKHRRIKSDPGETRCEVAGEAKPRLKNANREMNSQELYYPGGSQRERVIETETTPRVESLFISFSLLLLAFRSIFHSTLAKTVPNMIDQCCN